MPNLTALLEPRSIALIGASPNTGILRGKVQHALKMHGFSGPIFPISKTQSEVQGVKAYPTITDLPQSVDLAMIMIPAANVPETLEACGRAGVRAAYIVSSGFAEEMGGSGAKLQACLREIAARYDMAVAGPNGQGFFNVPAKVVATFSPAVENFAQPLAPETNQGRPIALVSQSGQLGFSYYSRGRLKQLRFNHIVSTGNEATVGSFDFVDWYLDSGRADVVLLYLEAIRDAATFRRVAAKAANLGKPIVVAKMGRSEVGIQAAASHTAALAGSDATCDAMFRRYGITRAYDMDQHLDIAAAFAFCPLPKGRRIAVLAGSGGAGVWMSDTLADQGLEVPPLDSGTRAELDALIPSYGSSRNPIDPTAVSRELGYVRLLEIVQRSPVIDAIVVVVNLTDLSTMKRDAEALGKLVRASAKPVLFCTPTLASPDAFEIVANAGMPLSTSMLNCAIAVRALADYAAFQERWRSSEETSAPLSDHPQQAERRQRTLELLGGNMHILGEHESKLVLEAYGVLPTHDHLVRNGEAAARVAEQIGYPVALKIHARGLAHKTEVGGIALNLMNNKAVRTAYREMIDRVHVRQPDLAVEGVLVQPMARAGLEMVVGVTRDSDFGPILMVGLGGIHVEVLHDVVYAPAPLTSSEAARLLQGLRGYKLLEGVRGAPPADIGALAAFMAAVSRFAADFADEIAEIDINPVIVHSHGQGLTVVDALIVKR